MEPAAHKVLIYATCCGRLLVFDEPDFPDVKLQVPGGTIEPGENPHTAALREFTEETGLLPDRPLLPLEIDDYRFLRDNQMIWHRRHYYAAAFDSNLPETWLHHELTPFDGGAPILFRFSWITIATAKTELGYGMERCLELLSQQRA